MPKSRRRKHRRPPARDGARPTLRQRIKGLGNATLLVLLAITALQAWWYWHVVAAAGEPAFDHLNRLPLAAWATPQALAVIALTLGCVAAGSIWSLAVLLLGDEVKRRVLGR